MNNNLYQILFDEFKNFEDRGHYFNNLIKKIKFIKKINAQSK